MTSTLILANHLGSHSVFEPLFIKLLGEFTFLISIELNFNLFKAIFEDLISY